VDYRNRNEVFERLGAMEIGPSSVTVSGAAGRSAARVAHQRRFDLDARRGARGRPRLLASGRNHRIAAIMVSHRLWQERFDGASDVIGRAIVVDGGLTPSPA
jgi:phage protein D